MFASFADVAVAFPWFFPTVAFLVGACVGSFLNVVIYRVPKEESIVTPGSHCGCGQPIKFYDNIPIFSWLLLRGRARCCGRPFSFRYPFVELLTGALFVVWGEERTRAFLSDLRTNGVRIASSNGESKWPTVATSPTRATHS